MPTRGRRTKPVSREMRVGLVIYGSLDTISGGYLYDRQLVAHLQSMGDTVELVALRWRTYLAHLSDNFSRSLFQRLRELRVDVLLQDELNHPSLFYLNRRLRPHVGYPIFSIVHHLRSCEAHPTWQRWIYRWIEQQYLASVDGFIFNSRTTRAAVSHVLSTPQTPHLIAYPAGDRFQVQMDTATIRQRAYQAGALRIVFLGNLIPRKGLHVLLDALARLPTEMWQLKVVGNPVDARYARKMRERASGNVQWLGGLDDKALARVLATSHLLVVPSTYEGYGIVYLEAMSFGLPAIATTAGAASEIITDGVNGYLIAPNDAAELAARLEQLACNRARLAQMSMAAHERFLAHPTWQTSLTQIRHFLLERVAEPRYRTRSLG